MLTSEAKQLLSTTIRGLRERLLRRSRSQTVLVWLVSTRLLARSRLLSYKLPRLFRS